MTGQRVNHEKSEFTCSSNIVDTMRTVLPNIIGMKLVQSHSKYLGLPTIISSNKPETFKDVEEKVSKKIQRLENYDIVMGRKGHPDQSLPASSAHFSMSCFKLPKSMSERLNALMLRFWWNGGKKKHGIHWARKDLILREKSLGGIGFRYMDFLNVALPMKQLWRILTRPDTLFSIVMSMKYCRQWGLLTTRARQTDSFAWKSIGGVRDIFGSGLIFEEGR